MTEASAAWRIVGITVGARSTTLEVAATGEVHEIHVSPAGAVLVPAGLARHPLREAIEAECLRMAVQARLSWMA